MANGIGGRAKRGDFMLAMAFQPIVDMDEEQVVAYEALVRGRDGEDARGVLAQVNPDNRYAFDQQCRVAAIVQAVAAGIVDTGARLAINFLPDAVYAPDACMQFALATARTVGLPFDRLVFEFADDEQTSDTAHVAHIVDTYRRLGFATALDDFGIGDTGLDQLAKLHTDVVKLDMALIRGIDANKSQRRIVERMVPMLDRMDIGVIAEGVETIGEYDALRALGLRYFQGHLFAKPAVRALPSVAYPRDRSIDASIAA